MSTLQILDDEEESYEILEKQDQPDIDYLKSLKETSQTFLQVNDFVIPEPDFGDFTEEDFIEYLEENLIPDLKDSELFATAEDFETAVHFMKGGK